MDLEVFYEVIVPLLEVDATAMIAISTPQVRTPSLYISWIIDLNQSIYAQIPQYTSAHRTLSTSTPRCSR